jgi:hypothetical protein
MKPDRQGVGQNAQPGLQAVGEGVTLAGVGVEDLSETPRQAPDVAQVQAAAGAPGATVRLATAVRREALLTSGAELVQAPGEAAHPGIQHHQLPRPQLRGRAGILDPGHDLVARHMRERHQAAEGVVGGRLQQDLLDVAAADAGPEGLQPYPISTWG